MFQQGFTRVITNNARKRGICTYLLVVYAGVTIALYSLHELWSQSTAVYKPHQEKKQYSQRSREHLQVRHLSNSGASPQPETTNGTSDANHTSGPRATNVNSASTLPIKTIVQHSGYDLRFFTGNTTSECKYKCHFVSGVQPQYAQRADVVVYDINGGAPRVPWPRPAGQIWVGFVWESPGIYHHLQSDEFLSAYNYTVSFDQRATFPVMTMMTDTTHDWSSMFGTRPRVSYRQKRNRISMMSVWISNCNLETSGRSRILYELEKLGISFSSYGACYFEAHPPDFDSMEVHNKTAKYKIESSSKYLFMYAAENSICSYYHSEKIYNAFLAGTVPVYLGASTIHEYVPHHSIINIADLKNVSQLARYLHTVANNETLYNSYHSWRHKPLPTSVRQKIQNGLQMSDPNGHADWLCRFCSVMHQPGPNQSRGFNCETQI